MAHRIRRRSLGLLSGLSVVAAVAACGNAGANTEDAATSQEPATSQDTATQPDGGAASAAPPAAPPAGASGTAFTDGTYTAEGRYSTPGGEEAIQVDLTVTGDVVMEVTVTPEGKTPNAKKFEGQFASGIAAEVVGQDLAGLSVDKVSGSSLTGGGFNAALDQIRADAAA